MDNLDIKEATDGKTRQRAAGSLTDLCVIGLLCSFFLWACGSDRTSIELGQTVAGAVTADDSRWTSCDPSQDSDCNAGYADKYQIDVTAGVTYTITFSSQTGAGVFFDDLEGGQIRDKGGSTSNSLWADGSPGRWVPSKSGTNRVSVDATSAYLPASYSFTITQGD